MLLIHGAQKRILAPVSILVVVECPSEYLLRALRLYSHLFRVSILVVVECPSECGRLDNSDCHSQCFNPCCGGMSSEFFADVIWMTTFEFQSLLWWNVLLNITLQGGRTDRRFQSLL